MNINTLTSLLSIFAMGISLFIALLILAKKSKEIPNLAFSLGLLSIGLIEFCDLMILQKPEHALLYKKISLTSESFLPGLWLLFSVTFARKEFREISRLWKIKTAL